MTAPERIDGRFELVDLLGSGGMGSVYRAVDHKIAGRSVAIKIIRQLDPDPALQADLLVRFRREADAAGALFHDNIVRILDVGDHRGLPYIAMEFIEGESLKALLARREPVSLAHRLRLARELCRGLHAAHSISVVHRDIKPANLMVERKTGRLKIVDFGIARVGQSGGTTPGTVLGSYNYMSPEQMRGAADVDPRSDIFSAGAVLYELLTFQQAFPAHMPVLMSEILAGEPVLPSLVDPSLGPVYDAIVSRALKKQREARYQSAEELLRDLEHIRPSEEDEATLIVADTRPDAQATLPHAGASSSPPTPFPAGRPDAGPAERQHEAGVPDESDSPLVPPPDREPSDAPSRRRMGWWQIAGGAIVLTLVVGTSVQLMRRERPREATPTAPASQPAANQGAPSTGGSNREPVKAVPAPGLADGTPAPGARRSDSSSAAASPSRLPRGAAAAGAPSEPPARQADGERKRLAIDDRLRRAERLHAQGDYEAAIAEFNAILSLDPQNQRAKKGRALAVEAKVMSAPPAAARAAEAPTAQAERRVPDREAELLEKADRLLKAGQYGAAVSAYDEVLAINGKNARAIAGKRTAVELKIMEKRDVPAGL